MTIYISLINVLQSSCLFLLRLFSFQLSTGICDRQTSDKFNSTTLSQYAYLKFYELLRSYWCNPSTIRKQNRHSAYIPNYSSSNCLQGYEIRASIRSPLSNNPTPKLLNPVLSRNQCLRRGSTVLLRTIDSWMELRVI